MPTIQPRRASPILWPAIAALLLIPAIAMRFTPELAWGVEDFAAAAVLLIGAGLAWEAARRIPSRRARILAALAILGLTALIWAELAVGLFR